MQFMKEKVFNFEYNHVIDVCKVNRQMERETEHDGPISRMESLARIGMVSPQSVVKASFNDGFKKSLRDDATDDNILDKTNVSPRAAKTSHKMSKKPTYSLNDISSDEEETHHQPEFGGLRNASEQQEIGTKHFEKDKERMLSQVQ